MKWEEAAPILKKVWEKEIKTNSGSYYASHIKEVIKKKGLLLKSVEKFGTPQYILDRSLLEKDAIRFRETFRKYIPNSEFFYALKSNDLPHLIKILKDMGYNADVGSLFELQLALKLGFKKIIFTSPGKTVEELRLAIKNSNRVIINVDNEDELERINALIGKNKIKISLRINSDDKLMQQWSKFGVRLKNLKNIAKKIENRNIQLIGLHFHCSWNHTPKRYCKNIRLIGTYLRNNFSKEFLSNLKFLDIGGGIYPENQATLLKSSHKGNLVEIVKNSNKKIEFDLCRFYIEKVDSLENFGKKISYCLKKYIFSLNKKIRVYLEPGRYLNTNSTAILFKVISEKENSVIVDGGINLIGDPDFTEYLFAPIVNLMNPSFRLNKKIIYGPLCNPDDLWGYSYFGENVKKNDILIILQQGSYTFSRAWRFLKETAPYIAIEGKKLILAKEKEKFEDRYAGCKFL